MTESARPPLCWHIEGHLPPVRLGPDAAQTQQFRAVARLEKVQQHREPAGTADRLLVESIRVPTQSDCLQLLAQLLARPSTCRTPSRALDERSAAADKARDSAHDQ